MAVWYVKSRAGTRGPLTEGELRQILDRCNGTTEIRQDGSPWMSSHYVRELFRRLDDKGFYIRVESGQEFGPFTKARVLELDHAQALPRVYWIRQGRAADWTQIDARGTTVPARQLANTRTRAAVPAAPVMKLRPKRWNPFMPQPTRKP